MKRVVKRVVDVSGIDAQRPVRQIPFGGFVSLKNMAQFEEGKLRKLPGVFHIGSETGQDQEAAIDASAISTYEFVPVPNVSALRKIAIFETGSSIQVVNQSSTPPVIMTNAGTPWVQSVAGLSSMVIYASQTLVAAFENVIKKITSAVTYADMVGTNIPQGYLMQPFYDRLYVAGTVDGGGLDEPFVFYTDILTNDFDPLNILNTSEIPGGVTALAVNAVSTDAAGIATDLLIFKSAGIFVYNEVRKDLLTESVGTNFYKAISNTTAGTIFLGSAKGIGSVYWLPFGQPVAPVDIGQSLLHVLNREGQYLLFAFSLFDGQFYRLHFGFSSGTVGSPTFASEEVWIDTDALAKTQKPVWFGVHQRGNFSAGHVNFATGQVNLIRPGIADSSRVFVEWNQFDAQSALSFGVTLPMHQDTEGQPLVAEIDAPLNVEPLDDKKTFGLLELQVTQRANLAGSVLTAQVIAEGQALDTQTISLYDANAKNANFVQVPLAAQGRISTTARDIRVRMLHSLDMEFELEGFAVQYERHEDERLRSKIRS